MFSHTCAKSRCLTLFSELESGEKIGDNCCASSVEDKGGGQQATMCAMKYDIKY